MNLQQITFALLPLEECTSVKVFQRYKRKKCLKEGAKSDASVSKSRALISDIL